MLKLAARAFRSASGVRMGAKSLPALGRGLAAAAALGGGGYCCSLTLSAVPAECAGAAPVKAQEVRPIRILCLHGISSDMYGSRGTSYGTTTLNQIDLALHTMALDMGVEIE